MEIQKVKVRFSKYKAETGKAYLLEYRKFKELWIPKKYCWNLIISGNDKHACTVMPVWFVNLKFDIDVNKLYNEIGIDGLKSYYDIVIEQTIKKHVPDRKEPLENNTIKRLKK